MRRCGQARDLRACKSARKKALTVSLERAPPINGIFYATAWLAQQVLVHVMKEFVSVRHMMVGAKIKRVVVVRLCNLSQPANFDEVWDYIRTLYPCGQYPTEAMCFEVRQYANCEPELLIYPR